MISYLKTIFEIGDSITISGNEGKTDGVIEAFGDDFLVLRTPHGDIVGVKDSAISAFAKPAKEEVVVEEPKAVISSPQQESVVKQPEIKEPEFKEFKPGDKIPLEELKQRDPSLASSWRRHKEKDEWQENRISAIKEAVASAKARESEEDEKLIPPQGAIVELMPSFLFGFIDDMQTGERYFFNRNDIVDATLDAMTGEQIEVVYQRTKNHKGLAARGVHRPCTVKELLTLVEQLVEVRGDLQAASRVLQNALTVFPENRSLQEVSEVVRGMSYNRRKNERWQSNDFQQREMDNYKVARFHLARREYDKALEYYQKAMAEGDHKTNCIKEITQVYISMHAQTYNPEQREAIRQTGLEFIQQHKDELPDDTSTLFSLENIYFALGDYSKHREIVDRIIRDSYANKDWPRYVFYQNKSAQNYLRVGDFNAAKRAVQEGLEVESNNPHLLKTQQSISDAENEGNSPSYSTPEYEEDDDDDRFAKYY